jgi:hypothetical protein
VVDEKEVQSAFVVAAVAAAVAFPLQLKTAFDHAHLNLH